MSFEYNYSFDDSSMAGFLVGYLLTFLLSGGLGIVAYVLRSLGVYTIAKRRELNHPWMAWVPVLDRWMLGSISDQYQYVTRRKNKNKRKWLIGLSIAMAVVYVAFWIVYIVLIVSVITAGLGNMDEMELLGTMAGPLIAMLVLCLPLVGLSIAVTVIRFMALYDLYRSVDPQNSTLYLVLSILVSISEPFFIFFNRNRDMGMPPRKQQAAYIPRNPDPVQPRQEAPAAEEVTPTQEPAQPTSGEAPVTEEAPAAPEAAPEAEKVDAEQAPAAEPIILGAAPAEEVCTDLPGEPAADADPWDVE